MTDEILADQAAGSAAFRAAAIASAANEPTEPEVNEPSVHDRARVLVDGYEHALATNSPRTVAELAELKALLDV